VGPQTRSGSGGEDKSWYLGTLLSGRTIRSQSFTGRDMLLEVRECVRTLDIFSELLNH
jgi:hypothetical protein